MAAATIPKYLIPTARTDADWPFNIALEGQDFTAYGVSVVFTRHGLPAEAFEASVANNLILEPTADLACGIRLTKALLADKTPGRYAVEARRMGDDGSAVDFAVFEWTLQRGNSDLLDPPASAGEITGNSYIVSGVIIGPTGTVVLAAAGGVDGRSAYMAAKAAAIIPADMTEAEYLALPVDSAAVADAAAEGANTAADAANAATAGLNAALADAADPGTPTYSAPVEPAGGFQLLAADPDRLYVTVENTTGSPLLVNEAGLALASLADPGQTLPASAVADIYVKGVVTAYSATGGTVHLTTWHRST